MIRAWQKRLLRSRADYTKDFNSAGTFQHTFEPGFYEITMVGGGGGGTSLKFASNNKTTVVDGGVGGVLKVKIKVLTDTTATIRVGGGGNSKSKYEQSNIGQYVPADNGESTIITGLTGVNLTAGAGTGAQNRTTPGTQGTNSYSGANIVSVLENNVRTITSGFSEVTATNRTGNPVYNTNFAENENKGCGGTVNWTGSTAKPVNGGIGFVRIKTIEK